ncbi:hypothetical protein PtB15_3B38 [Puccinia triticina]|nr:hypothetical protein PtB15_3B38 [Puccinia triticina]
MVLINFATIFSVLLHASLVISLPQPQDFSQTITLETENVGVIDLQRRFKRVLDAANRDDPLTVYSLVSGLQQYGIQMTAADGSTVTVTGGSDYLNLMDEFVTQIVFHTYDTDWVVHHATQAMELIQRTGYTYSIDTTVKRTTYESSQVVQVAK